jgi:leader peptidase (prepilin peptidase)/N-methyltransferase
MLTTIVIATFCFMIGISTGSFLGLCAYRIPMGKYEPAREGIPVTEGHLSVVHPSRSFCPQCKRQLSWLHVIPLFSWLFLLGRCGYCKAKIPFRYFLIELVSGLLCATCYLRFGLTPTAAVAFLIVSCLILITVIDIDYMIIPDIITFPGIALGVALGVASSFVPLPGILPLESPFVSAWQDSLLGILAGGGLLYAVWWLYLVVRKREGLGLGDIKLLAALGALFGPQCAILTIFIGSVFGSVCGIFMLLSKRLGFSQYLSFGPYLVAGALLYMFDFGDLIAFLRDRKPTTLWQVFH